MHHTHNVMHHTPLSAALIPVIFILSVKGRQTPTSDGGQNGGFLGEWFGQNIGDLLDPNSVFVVPIAVDYRTEQAVEYLKLYGYLPKHVKTSDKSFGTALRLFQQWAHVNETGELDSATWTMMHKQRCGLPDITMATPRRRRYVLHESHWNKRLISYCLSSYPDEVSFPKDDVHRTFDKAFKIWASVSSLSFQRFKKCPADIVIEFQGGAHGDGVPFDGRGGTLAHAYFPGDDGKGIHGDIHFDDAELWTTAKHRRGFENLFCTAVHEIGHSLGLRHTRKKGAVMWPWAQACKENPLSHDDIMGIQALYGPPRSYPAPTSFHKKPGYPSTQLRAQPTSGLSTYDGNATDVFPVLHTRVTQTTLPPTKQTTVTSEDANPCDGTIDAITVAADGNTYGFRDSRVFLFTFTAIASGYPRPISSVFPKGPTRVDAALTVTHREAWFPLRITYLFMGSSVWAYAYDHGKFILYKKPTSIMEEFAVNTNKIDAAFYLFRNDRFYLSAGNDIWEVSMDTHLARLSTGKPQSKSEVAELKGLPTFTAAVHWINGKIYFFEKTTYYRLERWLWFLQLFGPKSTAHFWFGCSKQD